ncbi:MAG: hypothetical protein ABIS09_06775 [Sphingomicrobium sp.]
MLDRTIDRFDAFALRYRRVLAILGGIWLVISWASSAGWVRLPEIPLLTGTSGVMASSAFAALWWSWLNPRINKRRVARDAAQLQETELTNG